MDSRSVLTAVAVLPPEEAWEPIQAIRRVHDRKFARWMPHVNLLYPFLPPERLDGAIPELEQACAGAAAFETMLAEFRHFIHPTGTATMWLAPEPADPWIHLREALAAAAPDSNDTTARFPGGFVPHLSVGQAPDAADARRTIASLRIAWKPLRFRVESVALLRRDPTGPFGVVRQFACRG